MTSADRPADLLAHMDFLRQLARDLVGESRDADDLSQEVVLRGLQRPPKRGGSLHGWLTTTARHVLWNERRGERRRAEREEVAARSEQTPSTADVVARESIRRAVVRAVLDLDEPFRETVLLRYYEGLAPVEIARRLGVPSATVRSRLARGLSRLRERLDAESGGDRSLWLGSLLPLARMPASNVPALALILTFGMHKLVWPFAALLISLLGWWAWPTAEPPEPTPLATSAAPTQADVGRAMQEEETTRSSVIAAEESRSAEQRRGPVMPAERGVGSVRGLVLGPDGRPRAGVQIEVTPFQGTLALMHRLTDDRDFRLRAVTSTDGRFEFPEVVEGPVQVRAEDAGLEDTEVAVASASDPGGPTVLELREPRSYGEDIRIEVLNGGELVAGAQVELFGWSMTVSNEENLARPHDEPIATATTTSEGLAVFRGLGVRNGVAIARTEDGLCGRCRVTPRSGWNGEDPLRCRIDLASSCGLEGRLVGLPPGDPGSATLVIYFERQVQLPWISPRYRVDVPVTDGRFAIDGLPAGFCSLAIESESGIRVLTEDEVAEKPRDPRVPPSLPTVELIAGTSIDRDLKVTLGGAIEGQIIGPEGPVRGAKVRAYIDLGSYERSGALGPLFLWELIHERSRLLQSSLDAVTAMTDDSGRYRIDGLVPGAYQLEVVAEGLSTEVDPRVVVQDGATARSDHVLREAGALQITALGLRKLVLRPLGGGDPRCFSGIEGGCLTVTGLRPGPYSLEKLSHNRFSFLQNVEVSAGRTTWVDLRGASLRSRLEGRIRRGSQPVEGAVVRFEGAAITDAKGRFAIEIGFLPRFLPHAPGIRIRAGGCQYHFRPSVKQPGSAAFFDVDLGETFVELACLDSDGVAARARVRVSSGSAAIDGGLLSIWGAVETDESGIARVPTLATGKTHCSVQFEDGFGFGLGLPAGATGSREVVRPETGLLRVQALEGGRPAGNVSVTILSWLGEGPVPDSIDEVYRDGAEQRAKTDAYGLLEHPVRCGHAWVRATSIDHEDFQWRLVEITPSKTASVTLSLER